MQQKQDRSRPEPGPGTSVLSLPSLLSRRVNESEFLFLTSVEIFAFDKVKTYFNMLLIF